MLRQELGTGANIWNEHWMSLREKNKTQALSES